MKFGVWRILRGVDDFLIDRVSQPAVNMAFHTFGISKFGLSRLLLVAGAAAGLAWVHKYYGFPSEGFYEHFLVLGLLVLSSTMIVLTEEFLAPKRSNAAPLARMSGLMFRMGWVALLLAELVLLALSRDRQASLEYLWNLVVISPNWIICCGTPPPRQVTKAVLAAGTA
jgi:hypothetical protein